MGNQTPEKGRRRRCKESTRKSSKPRTTHHEKTQMQSQSPVCFRSRGAEYRRRCREVKLRSRRSSNEWLSFLMSRFLMTPCLSHELCHNKYGPHTSGFYNLLDEILKPMELICEACGTQRHKDAAKFKVRSCKFCTLDNSVELDRCEACGEWRYSCGPPVST